MLSLNNVSVAYQKRDAVQDVTFELGVGQIGCLLGPSGCGKTSLLRAIAGFEKVEAGQILLRKKLVKASASDGTTAASRIAGIRAQISPRVIRRPTTTCCIGKSDGC